MSEKVRLGPKLYPEYRVYVAQLGFLPALRM
jgi:hypothetical protein